MRNLISLLLVILVSVGMIFTDAHAKRFGGGRSFGMQRSVSSFSRAKPASTPVRNAAANPARNKWLAPLAGLALGGLIGSLLMGNGFANGMMSWLLVAGVVMLLVSLVRGFTRNRVQPASASPFNMFRDNTAHDMTPASGTHAAVNDAAAHPPGFDEYEFLRAAKVQFIRLQAAYDQKNLDDLSQFTTPEVFAEIKLQLNERGDKENQTDVVTLDAKLLDVVTEFRDVIASVEFTGLIREDRNEPSAAFTEVWHFVKNEDGKWLTAGIQQ